MSIRAQIRDGNPAAFEQLFDDYAKAVYNHAFRLTANWSAAEDVMALTFLEASSVPCVYLSKTDIGVVSSHPTEAGQ